MYLAHIVTFHYFRASILRIYLWYTSIMGSFAIGNKYFFKTREYFSSDYKTSQKCLKETLSVFIFGFQICSITNFGQAIFYLSLKQRIIKNDTLFEENIIIIKWNYNYVQCKQRLFLGPNKMLVKSFISRDTHSIPSQC